MDLVRKVLAYWICSALLLFAVACSDPSEEPGYRPSGEPAVTVGFYVGRAYSPLTDGQDCPVVHGLQGGTWTMPTIRARGIAERVAVVASLVTESGETVGSLDTERQFVVADDGWLEVEVLPIAVRHEAPNQRESIDDLYGQSATLSLSVKDDAERSAEQSVRVVLSEG